MMRQLLIAALISGGILTTSPMAYAKPKDKAEQAEKPAGKKKDKKKKDKGAAADKKKPEAFSHTGTIQKTEKDGKKPTYAIVTGDGEIQLKGKKAAELESSVNKSVTITGKGKLMEKGDAKSLVIIALDGVVATEN